ncbi:MAG: hypothetical protein LBG87_04855 [Spirochaetaceae bacterium]|jgi:hypothetical protein|nr:hypothetical protein [Spirochaetaceae bacterium]
MNIQSVSAGTPQFAASWAHTVSAPRSESGFFGPAVTADISPAARQAYTRSQEASSGAAESDPASGLGECETCKNRKYKDGSTDPSVSFQSPAHIDPNQAASAVAAHEGEHVSREQLQAEQENRKVISQTVRLKTGVCPECGRVYISGGVTRTVTAPDRPPSGSAETAGLYA